MIALIFFLYRLHHFFISFTYNIRNNLLIEIIEADQDYEPPELAHPIESSNIIFKNLFPRRNSDNLSFYIRLKNMNDLIVTNF